MRNANRKHLLINLAAIGLNIILLVMLGWRTLLAQESGPYRQYLSLIRTLPHLASELEEWCIEEQATLPSYGTLTILSGEAINNIGSCLTFTKRTLPPGQFLAQFVIAKSLVDHNP
jgi:hypothetical protein